MHHRLYMPYLRHDFPDRCFLLNPGMPSIFAAQSSPPTHPVRNTSRAASRTEPISSP